MDIKWLGHASARIAIADKIIYIDPWKIKNEEPADIILVTHSHYDHCSAEDIAKLKKNTTVIIAPKDCFKKLPKNTRTISPGESIKVDDIVIEAYPAYNTDKPFHPKSNQWVGYVIVAENTRIYHAGDTDCIPEMSQINADIALLPIGGTYTMNSKEAAQAAQTLRAKKVIPIHYGDIVGSNSDAKDFVKLCPIPVEILTR